VYVCRKGIDSITWNRKLHGRAAKPGLYRLIIIASHSGRQTSSSILVRLSWLGTSAGDVYKTRPS
jgi:hypothetical protein